MTTRSTTWPTTRLTTRATTSPCAVAGSSAFDPNSIASILQNLGSPLSYAASPLGNVPVLESSIGEVGTPRGQSCVALDGSNDYLTLGARLTSGSPSALTVCAWVKLSSLSGEVIAGEYATGNRSWLFYVESDNLGFTASSNGTDTTSVFSSIESHLWVHVAAVYSAGTVTLYVNGSSVASGSVGSIFNGTSPFIIGMFSNAYHFSGSMYDPRIYSSAKTSDQIAAIANQHLTPDTIDTTNALGIWPLQDESGTKCYDVSGNGNDLTATNVDTTPGAFRTTDSGVKYSFPNQFGYTNNAGVIIPADLDNPTLDCEGDALETPGQIWLPGVMEVPCVTFSGTDYAIASSRIIPTNGTVTICGRVFQSSLAASRTIFSEYSSSGTVIAATTATGFEVYCYTDNSNYSQKIYNNTFTAGVTHHLAITVSGTTIKAYVDGVEVSPTSTGGMGSFTGLSAVSTAAFRLGVFSTNMWFFTGRLSDWRIHSTAKSDAEVLAISQGYDDRTNLLAHWGCQDGPGDDNDNRTLHDNSGNGHHLTVTNGTVSDQWANRTVVVKDQCIVAGGGIAANGAFVPGIPGSANDAAGNAKTLAAGKHGNPYSKLLRNYFSAPALVNIGCTSSDKEAPGYDVQSESVANTRFRRTAADGDDRDLSFSEAQTGETLANIEEWVS